MDGRLGALSGQIRGAFTHWPEPLSGRSFMSTDVSTSNRGGCNYKTRKDL